VKYFIALLIIVAIVGGFIGYRSLSKHTVSIRTDKKTYKLLVEIADDSSERALGLMNREFFSDDKAMLFIYEKEGHPSFWMKNMNFPLDIIFIGSDFKIRQIEQEVQPCFSDALDCPRMISSFPVQYVLEVNSGYTKRRQIKVGNVVNLSL